MELLKPEDRQRLLGMRGGSSTQTPQEAVQPAAEDVSSSGLRQQQEALTMWKGVQTSSQTFRPFEQNPSKQARYELYLDRLQQGDRGRRPRPTHHALQQPLCAGPGGESLLCVCQTVWSRVWTRA